MAAKKPIRISRRGETTGSGFPTTPDGRYFVVRGRLWRKTDPALDSATRDRLVKDLMKARREIAAARTCARKRVHATKVMLGERGPVWNAQDDDHSRCMVRNSPYADWYAGLDRLQRRSRLDGQPPNRHPSN